MNEQEYKNIQRVIELSINQFNSENPYKLNKEIINVFFNKTSDISYKEIIRVRILLIDTCYSTNVNRMRHFGIDDICNFILKFKNDKTLHDIVKRFIDTPNIKDYQILFKESFGTNRNGDALGNANSLLSKYYFYLTGMNFPIYDSLVKKSYSSLARGYNLEKIRSYQNTALNTDEHYIDYFTKIKKLKDILNIKTYNELDMFLWLGGKIISNNYYLILTKNKRTLNNTIINFWNNLKPN